MTCVVDFPRKDYKLDFDIRDLLRTSISTVPYCVDEIVMIPARQHQKCEPDQPNLIGLDPWFQHFAMENIVSCMKSHHMVQCKYPCELKKVSWLNEPVWYRNPLYLEGILANYLTDMVHNRLIESGYDPSKYGENYFYPSIAFVNRGDNWFETKHELI